MRERVSVCLVAAVVTSLTPAVRVQPAAAAGAAPMTCPTGVNGRTAEVAQVDGVIAAARRAVIDDKTETNQGRVTKRTAANYPVVEVVDLSRLPLLPGAASLMRLAVARCGKITAQAAWAVVFRDTESVLCCVRDVVFVVHLRSGWKVF